jgi:hypothetical protein
MKFLSDRVTPDGEAPYKGDILGNREEYGNSLIKFINRVEDGCVISIDAKWGEGKTTFVKWWSEDLKKDHVPIYFDAFKHDFNGEPFMAIVKTLFNQFPDSSKLQGDVSDAFSKLVGETIPALLSFGAIAGGTMAFGPAGAAGGLIAAAGASSLGDFVKKFLSKGPNKTLEETIEDFRTKLETITSSLYLEKKKRLVFIVDELDRCRPSFAVEVIEKIKHLFSVPGIIWVLVMNKEQLEDSIRHVYGTIDTSKYLTKFINVTSYLPKTVIDQGSNYTLDHYRTLVSAILARSNFLNATRENLKVLLSEEARLFELSIREVHMAFRYIELLVGDLTPGNNLGYLMLGSFLCVLKVSDGAIYKQVKKKGITVEQLKGKLRILSDDGKATGVLVQLPLYLQFALCKSSGQVQSLLNSRIASGKMDQQIVKEIEVFQLKEGYFLQNAEDILDVITRKIDIMEFQ